PADASAGAPCLAVTPMRATARQSTGRTASVRFPVQLPAQELTDPMPKTVILGAARTPFGKLGGALAPLDATELGGQAISAALERAEVGPDQVEHVVFGQVLQAGQGQIPSRQAQIKAGIP